LSGLSGFSGSSGYSGYSGKSGYSGYSGFSGYSGYSGAGASGFSGYSGFSGFSGYSGASATAASSAFNSTSSWVSANSGADWSYTFAHNLNSNNILVGCWDSSTGEQVFPRVVRTDANTVVIYIAQNPDLRFAGLLIINGAGASGFSGYSGAGSPSFANNVWLTDAASANRFYFATSSQTIFEAANGFQFRNGSDATVMNIDTNGIVKMGPNLADIKLALYDNNTGSAYYGFGVQAGYVVATANDVQCVYFSANAGGSLGVHNNSPQAYLDVAGSVAPGAVGVEDLFYMTRPTQGGVSYLEMAGFALGRWATTGSFEPKSRLDIKLKDAASSTASPEITVMTLQSNKCVGVAQTLPTAYLDIGASTTTNASLRIRSGTAPTSPNDGDIWYDGTNVKIRVGGTTKTFTIT
jgi:hypothetical protein